MKFNLAENMIRFGVKNLNKTQTEKVKTIAEQSTPTTTEPIPAQAKTVYDAYKDRMYRIVFASLVTPTRRGETNIKDNTIYYDWNYPENQLSGKLAGSSQNTYKIGSDSAKFDTEFKNHLKQGLNDTNFLTKVAVELNKLFNNAGTNNPDNDAKAVQTYIRSRFPEGDKRVQDNGTPGQKFNDGVFYAHTTKAYLELFITNFLPHKMLELTSAH